MPEAFTRRYFREDLNPKLVIHLIQIDADTATHPARIEDPDNLGKVKLSNPHIATETNDVKLENGRIIKTIEGSDVYEWLYDFNRELIDQIKNLKPTNDELIIELISFSTRWHPELDAFNQAINKNGSHYRLLEKLEIKLQTWAKQNTTSKKTAITLNKKLLSDVFYPRENNLLQFNNKDGKKEYSNPFADETKVTHILYNLHSKASSAPNALIKADIFEDKTDILTSSYNFYFNNPHLLPYNCELRFYQTNPIELKSPTKVHKTIKGTGPIRYNVAADIKNMEGIQVKFDHTDWLKEFAKLKDKIHKTDPVYLDLVRVFNNHKKGPFGDSTLENINDFANLHKDDYLFIHNLLLAKPWLAEEIKTLITDHAAKGKKKELYAKLIPEQIKTNDKIEFLTLALETINNNQYNKNEKYKAIAEKLKTEIADISNTIWSDTYTKYSKYLKAHPKAEYKLCTAYDTYVKKKLPKPI